jgi:hypothetical protein
MSLSLCLLALLYLQQYMRSFMIVNSHPTLLSCALQRSAHCTVFHEVAQQRALQEELQRALLRNFTVAFSAPPTTGGSELNFS